MGQVRAAGYVAVMVNTSVLASASRSCAGDFVALMKPRAMALAVFTTLARRGGERCLTVTSEPP
jgi:hypothetical protein